jgi:predicted alpha-1,2-mannosidase
VFDNVLSNSQVTLDPGNGALTAYSDAKSGLSAGATRIFIYATFDKPVVGSGMLSDGGLANATGFMRFNAGTDHIVTMRIATSLLSVAQAKANLALEIAPADTFEAVEARAQKLWDDKLGTIEVEGANSDELTTLYSNLYRLFLYPNSAFENTGTAEAPVYQYASPVSAATGITTATQTGAHVVNGTMYVNNGFWDTYRATWPAYALLSPGDAGAMIKGFAQQYVDGGWVARWSSPGWANLMTGTSSDVAFADAYVKGVTGFDAATVYDAAIRNATVRPPTSAIGRNGLETSIFLGYTPSETDAGISWAMAGYLNDFGIANLAQKLADANPDDPRHQEYAENAIYFRNRAQNYVNMFDPSIQFFQGRTTAGPFERTAANYDPREWGNGYTETDGWNTAFDPTFDGLGVANLYGGRDKLADKLDAFFATPETASFVGSYGGIIHEMLEARDVRMGQLGLSNQVSFHIIYMYDHAGQPAKTQAKVRDALGRLFVGSGLGQGYLGDEDNGAMSSWQIFSALGFYPLEVGSPSYVIGSPLFTKATIHLENGKSIVINAPKNSAANIYVQGLQVNGQPYTSTSLPHDLLAAGATLDFDMGPAPSTWGTAEADAPPSLTTDGNVPRPLADTASGGTAIASDGTATKALFDNTSLTQATFTAANPQVQYQYATGTHQVTFYTLTSSSVAADPTGWILSGSNDGSAWTPLDQRSAQTFPARMQTRAFQVATPGDYAFYRLEFTAGAGMALAEIELLAKP